MFVDREKELEILDDCLKSKKFEFMVVYGRRRIGKTELIKEFMKDKRRIYFLCSNRKIQYNLKRFSEKISEYLQIPKVSFESFQDSFDALLGAADEKIIIVLDEFGYLVRKDGGALSDFQEIVDEKLKGRNVFLILCGSSISIMETQVIGLRSPLYGRATRQLRVKPFEFKVLRKWFPESSLEDLMKIYAATGGVAKYLEFFSGRNVDKEIQNTFFDNSSFLFGDAIRILSEELRDYSTYIQILEAIGLGYNKVNGIADYAYIESKDVFFYFNVLSSLGIVSRMSPVFSPKKAKRGLYFIDDNYFNFWFRFVSPFQSEIDGSNMAPAVKNFEDQFNTYLGDIFEREVRLAFSRKNLLSFSAATIGKWWHKDVDIDVVAANEKTKEIAFVEVKWKKLSERECLKIIEGLREKAKFVDWRKRDRKEYFGIVAKSVADKAMVREKLGKDCIVYDMEDALLD